MAIARKTQILLFLLHYVQLWSDCGVVVYYLCDPAPGATRKWHSGCGIVALTSFYRQFPTSGVVPPPLGESAEEGLGFFRSWRVQAGLGVGRAYCPPVVADLRYPEPTGHQKTTSPSSEGLVLISYVYKLH